MVRWLTLCCVLLAWPSERASAHDRESGLLFPAGFDVGSTRHAGVKSPKFAAELSVVRFDSAKFRWFGGFAAAGVAAGGAEAAFGAELGVLILGVDAGPIWRASAPGGWGWRTRIHLTWPFCSLYVGLGEFAQGRQILDVGYQWKPEWRILAALHRAGGVPRQR